MMDWKKAWEVFKLLVPRPDLSYKASGRHLEQFLERSPGILDKATNLVLNLRMTPGYFEKAKILFGPQGQLLQEEYALAYSDLAGYIGYGVGTFTDLLTIGKGVQIVGKQIPHVSKLGQKMTMDWKLATRYPIIKKSKNSPYVATGVERTKRGFKKYDNKIKIETMNVLPGARRVANVASYGIPVGTALTKKLLLTKDKQPQKAIKPFNWNTDAIPPHEMKKDYYPTKHGQVGWGTDIGEPKQKGVLTDIWLREQKATKSPTAFDWNSDAIPPHEMQKVYHEGEPGQVGWGMDIGAPKQRGVLTDIWLRGNQAAKDRLKFDWDSDAIPPHEMQKHYYKGEPGQVGWGLDIGAPKQIGVLTDIWLRGNQVAKDRLKFDWNSDAISPYKMQKHHYRGEHGQVRWGMDIGAPKQRGVLTDIWLRGHRGAKGP